MGLSSKQHRRSRQSDPNNASSSSSSRRDKRLYLSVRVQLGSLEPQLLKPVPLNPDGTADVCQAAVFAVTRPLEEAQVTYRLGLQRGPRGTPLLSLEFQYSSLLHLLRRSPTHSYVWEDWKAVARATVSGLQVRVGGVGGCVCGRVMEQGDCCSLLCLLWCTTAFVCVNGLETGRLCHCLGSAGKPFITYACAQLGRRGRLMVGLQWNTMG